MIKFDTEQIQKYAYLCTRRDNNKFMFLSFSKKKIYFSSPKMIGSMIFNFEDDGEISIPDFAVDINMFIALCNNYNSLNCNIINDKFVFSYGKDSFKILTNQDLELSNYNIEDDDIENIINFEDEDIHLLNESLLFVSTEHIESNGVQIFEKDLFASNRYSIYLAKLHKDYPLLKLSPEIVFYIKSLPNSFLTTFKEKDSLKIANDEVVIYSTQLENLLVPQFNEDEFIKKYNHDTFIDINKEELINILKFFKPFVEGVTNEVITIKVIDENNLEIITSEFAEIVKSVTSKNSPELIGTEFLLGRNTTKDILSIIEDDMIRIKIDLTKPAIDFIGVTLTDKHIAISRIE